MPSNFAEGRPSMPKTLADLIRQLSFRPATKRRSFSSSPVARMQGNKRSSNRETEQKRRSRASDEALKALRLSKQ